MAYLKVRATAGARADAIVGWRGDVLRVRVRAAPERGKANDAVCQLIARRLGVATSLVTVAKGAGARDKQLWIEGLSDDAVSQRIGRG